MLRVYLNHMPTNVNFGINIQVAIYFENTYVMLNVKKLVIHII